jgi:hypothetical protein
VARRPRDTRSARWSAPIGTGLVVGATLAAVDNVAFGGEMSPAVVVVMLLVATGAVGLVWGTRGWFASVPIWACVPLPHVAKHALGIADTLHPDSCPSIVLLALFSLAVAAAGTASGVLVRSRVGGQLRSATGGTHARNADGGLGRRKDDTPPRAVSEWGWRFHHVGVPTSRRMSGECYIEAFKVHVSGFESSPYGVQWMRYEAGSLVDELERTVPHVAFEVDDLGAALAGKQVITPPNSPSPGVTVAMIIDNGCPIELIRFDRE